MRAILTAVALVGVCFVTRAASADAVPPPPASCPKGHVGITGHGGPKCVLEAPKKCPPGYRGEIGGKCVLATCASDDGCEDGRRCLSIETCQEFRQLTWTGWGWSAMRAPASRDNFLGGPPRPQPEGPPKKAWVNLHICGQDGACNAPAECRPASLCYPPDAIGKTKAKLATVVPDAAAPPAADAGPEVIPVGPDEPPYVDETASPVTSSAPSAPQPAPSDSGGCRKGCAVGTTAAAMGWMGLPLLAGLGWWRRRRGRRELR